MDKPSVNIKYSSFPSQFATESEKESEAYGLSVGKAIESEWFSRVGQSCRYYNSYNDYHTQRLYARGEQSIEKYKSSLKVNGDLSHLNLDWKIIPAIPKFIDIVVNGMNDRLYSIRAESQDVLSAERKNIFQDMVEADMAAKDFLTQTKDEFGIDAFNVPPDEIPGTPEELELYMQMKYKPSIEIAAEVAIDTVFEMNDYTDVVKPKINYDLVTVGIGAAKHMFLPGAGIQVERVDPATLVHSYTDKEDFSDCYYFGEVKSVHYTELMKINPNLTELQLMEIKQAGSAWNQYYPIANQYNDNASGLKDESVTLLYFNYKSTKKFVHKKKKLDSGGEKVIPKTDAFNPSQEDADKFSRVDVVKDVWYDGVMVLGSNIIVKWELLKNMVRPKAATQKAMSNYVVFAPRMYLGKIESTTSRMMPFADQIQLTCLKLQQIKAKMIPDGVFIDADGLNEIDLGNGSKYSAMDALGLYMQTGSVVGRSLTTDGEYNNARIPIQPLTTNGGQAKMMALIGDYNHNLNMIRDCTGINEVRDGSTPNPDALVGVQKLAALSSNTATNHILRAGLSITKKLAQGASLRISDVLEHADFKEEFAMQIGKYNISILEDIKDLYLHSLGIFIELMPDAEENAILENNIQISLTREQIDLEDAIDIRMIKNIKMANEMLKLKRKKRAEARSKEAQKAAEYQMQTNMQSQQAAAQAKQQQAQIDAQTKIAIINAQNQADKALLDHEVTKKLELMREEFQMNMQLKGVEAQALSARDDKKEEAKDKRVDIQATKQSKLIEQRQNNLPPTDFESSEDSLDGFDLASFEPR